MSGIPATGTLRRPPVGDAADGHEAGGEDEYSEPDRERYRLWGGEGDEEMGEGGGGGHDCSASASSSARIFAMPEPAAANSVMPKPLASRRGSTSVRKTSACQVPAVFVPVRIVYSAN
jgi:hypothetical protein